MCRIPKKCPCYDLMYPHRGVKEKGVKVQMCYKSLTFLLCLLPVEMLGRWWLPGQEGERPQRVYSSRGRDAGILQKGQESHFFFKKCLGFFLFFLSDTFTCPILGALVPLFWISGDVSPGFQSQNGFCLIRIVEANVMYISWDPPLVLHIADLLTDSIAGHRPCSYLAQGYYCVAAVSIEPAINRSWGPCANHSATRLVDTYMCPILGPMVAVFCVLWVSKPEWVLPYSDCGDECNVHFPDPPLVLHLPTSWQPARLPVASLLFKAHLRLANANTNVKAMPFLSKKWVVNPSKSSTVVTTSNTKCLNSSFYKRVLRKESRRQGLDKS